MTDLEWLRLAAWPGLILMTISTLFLVPLYMNANGQRPAILALLVGQLFIWSISAGGIYQAYQLDQINSTGTAYVYVWWVRVAPAFVGAMFLYVGAWYWRHRPRPTRP